MAIFGYVEGSSSKIAAKTEGCPFARGIVPFFMTDGEH
jgi:hypothetical protein